MTFESVLQQYFHTVYPEVEFVEKTYSALNEAGFANDNAIVCVGVCRDEISQTLVETVQRKWGYAFNLSSLAGMFFAGKTGLLAAMHHAPNMGDKERYVFYSFTHIAVDRDGKLGACARTGRNGESSACGALNAFQKELAEGEVRTSTGSDDIEFNLIKARLLKKIPFGFGSAPDLLELTKIAQQTVQTDLESAIAITVNAEASDYAVIAGIQVHGPDGNYIQPETCYVVIDGTRQELELG